MNEKEAREIRLGVLEREHGKCQRCGTYGSLIDGLCRFCLKELTEAYEKYA